MRTIDQLKAEALKTVDPGKLYSLFEEAVKLAEFKSAQRELMSKKVEKLQAQVDRQIKMITDLDNALKRK